MILEANATKPHKQVDELMEIVSDKKMRGKERQQERQARTVARRWLKASRVILGCVWQKRRSNRTLDVGLNIAITLSQGTSFPLQKRATGERDET